MTDGNSSLGARGGLQVSLRDPKLNASQVRASRLLYDVRQDREQNLCVHRIVSDVG